MSSFHHVFKEEVGEIEVVGDFCVLPEVPVQGAVVKVFQGDFGLAGCGGAI